MQIEVTNAPNKPRNTKLAIFDADCERLLSVLYGMSLLKYGNTKAILK